MANVSCKIVVGRLGGYVPYISITSPVLNDLNGQWFRMLPDEENVDSEYPTAETAEAAARKKASHLLQLASFKEIEAGIVPDQKKNETPKQAEQRWANFMAKQEAQMKNAEIHKKLYPK
jgi:hypothetical protein